MTRYAPIALAVLTACAQSSSTSSYQYPDNGTLAPSAFIDAGAAVQSLHIKDASQVIVRKGDGGTALLRWSQVVTPQIALRTVAPGRMVYEITAVHARPFTVGPTNYLSGRQTTIVDAQTGTWLITTARGTLASRTKRTP